MINFLVNNGTPGQTLSLYRSEDGNSWSVNTPDASCTLTSDKHCNFFSDTLSYFAVVSVVDGISPTIGSGVVCTDADGCVCSGSNILYGSTCVISVAVTPSPVITPSG